MKRVKKILSKILEINENEITDESSPDNIETWDSFNGLMIASELENEFNVKFTMEEVTSVKSVKDIRLTLEKHGIKINHD